MSLENHLPYPSLQGRVVILTGGARGLGLVMAEALARRGARLMLTAARSAEELSAARAAIDAINPGQCRTLLADVSDWAACQRVAAETKAAFGRIDVLINNAARAPMEAGEPSSGARPAKFWESRVEGYQHMVDTNFVGPFLMAKAVTPDMLAQGFGKIINISTSRSNMVRGGGGAYSACKAGLEAASVIWSKDLQGTGVTVNVLLPGGPSDTALLVGGGKGALADHGFKAGKGVMGREGAPGDNGMLPPAIMGPPALWLCADESNAYTGRRVVARDWDPDSPIDDALAAAMAPVGGQPQIM